MNGAEHYEQAEALLKVATAMRIGSDDERWAIGAAQVHATLALAALRPPHIAPNDNWAAERALWCHVLYGEDRPAEKPDGER